MRGGRRSIRLARSTCCDYRAADLVSLKIGEDAIVDLTHWSLSGHAMKPLRGAISRVERADLSICFHAPPLPDDLVAGLREVSDEWLSPAGAARAGFTLGQWNDAYIRRSPVFTADTHPTVGSWRLSMWFGMACRARGRST